MIFNLLRSTTAFALIPQIKSYYQISLTYFYCTESSHNFKLYLDMSQTQFFNFIREIPRALL